MHEKSILGKFKANIDYYNLLEVITLYIGDDTKTDNKLLKMLDKIFSKKYNVDEKKKYLQDECGIAMTDTEVDTMCNYSDYVENRGKQERLLQDIRSLMETLNLSAEKAMQALKVSPEEQAELLAEL